MLPVSSILHKYSQQSCKLDLELGCLSTSLMSRSEDISFGMGSSIGWEVQSPTFNCKSSFSSFLSTQLEPASEAGGFSFHGSSGSNTLEYSTPVLALPSFAFYSSSCAVEQQTDALVLTTSSSTVNSIPKGNLCDKILFSISSVFFGFWKYSKLLLNILYCRKWKRESR